MPFEIALYPQPATTSPRAFELRTVDWDELKVLLEAFEEAECGAGCKGSRCPLKDGQGWSPVRFKDPSDPYRLDANVAGVGALVFDVDEWAEHDWKPKLANMEQALEGTSYILHSTHASRPDFLKLRLVIQLSRELTPEEFNALWLPVVDRFFIPTKRTLGNISRFFFLPSCPDGLDPIFHVEEGKPLDVDRMLERLPKIPKAKPAAARAADAEGGESTDMDALREALKGDTWGDLVVRGEPIGKGQGSNHDALRSCFNELARKTLAFSPEAVLELLQQGSFAHPEHYGTPPEEEFRLIFQESREFWLNREAEQKKLAQAAAQAVRESLRAPLPKTEPVDTPPQSFPTTDTGNAERLVARYGKDFLYCPDTQVWMAWTGKRYVADRGNSLIQECGKETIRAMKAEAQDPETIKHAYKCEAESKRRAMLTLAKYELPVQGHVEKFDADPLLLNVANGIVDLKLGKLVLHDRSARMTKIAYVQYDAAAKCVEWEKFLVRVLSGDEAVISFLQRFVGYCLTGDMREQVFVFFWGEGRNGKSTLCQTLLALLGDYAMPAPPHLLESKSNPAHPAEIADLMGARLVICQETDDNKRLDEPLVKQLTGGDSLKARKMRQDFFTFVPTHKLILAGNHKPSIRGMDFAMWRRILLVPFLERISDEECDPTLPEKLRGELPGILAWAVRGCLEWQAKGLRAPKKVQDATDNYKRESDVLRGFLEEHTTRDADGEIKAAHLYTKYRSWCEATGERVMTQTALGRRLHEKGYEHAHKRDGMWWTGLRFKTAADSHLSVVPKPSEGAGV